MLLLTRGTLRSAVGRYTGWKGSSAGSTGEQEIFTKVEESIQEAYADLVLAIDPERHRKTFFHAFLAPFKSGTITTTQDSTTITLVGSTWTAADIEGRFFLKAGDNVGYEVISRDSPTTGTLARAYQGVSEAGKAYEILDFRIDLPQDLRWGNIINWKTPNEVPVNVIDQRHFGERIPTPVTVDQIGLAVTQPPRDDTYTTGTVTASKGDVSITVTAGAMVTAGLTTELDRYAKFVAGGFPHRIKSIDSETTLTLFDPLAAALTGASFTILRRNPRALVYPYPAGRELHEIVYGAYPNPLAADDDIPEIPDDAHQLLLYHCLEMVYSHQNLLERATRYANLYREGLIQLKRNLRKNPARVHMEYNNDD